MPSNRPNRPPGQVSTHNVEVEFEDYEHVSDLAEVTETIDEYLSQACKSHSQESDLIVNLFISHSY